jgi:hypothetical protein
LFVFLRLPLVPCSRIALLTLSRAFHFISFMRN